jgi:hypothetical protein
MNKKVTSVEGRGSRDERGFVAMRGTDGVKHFLQVSQALRQKGSMPAGSQRTHSSLVTRPVTPLVTRPHELVDHHSFLTAFWQCSGRQPSMASVIG